MRDKFSELIKAGIAPAHYKTIIPNEPIQDEICRIYNNIFSIPSDTHMTIIDGKRYITGHMIGTEKWNEFVISFKWGYVDFRTSGYWCVRQLLNKFGLKDEYAIINGDKVVAVVDYVPEEDEFNFPTYTYTSESLIPLNVQLLTTDNRIEHLYECFSNPDVIGSLNKSAFIKGNNWMKSDNNIIGLVGDKVVIMDNVIK